MPSLEGEGSQGGEGKNPLILIAEDEGDFADILIYTLKAAGYRHLWARDGAAALHMARRHRPQLLLLDWMLPAVSGPEICRQLRADKALRNIPIIMLTAKGEEEDRILGLRTGADDYLVKPFSMKEMVARAEALLRRSGGALRLSCWRHGDLEVEERTWRVRCKKHDVHMGKNAAKILAKMMEHPERIFTREELIDAVWGESHALEPRTVDVFVGRMRKALKRDCACNPIKTVHATGYVFSMPTDSAS